MSMMRAIAFGAAQEGGDKYRIAIVKAFNDAWNACPKWRCSV